MMLARAMVSGVMFIILLLHLVIIQGFGSLTIVVFIPIIDSLSHFDFISISGSLQYSVLIINFGLLPIVVFIITTGSLWFFGLLINNGSLIRHVFIS